MKCRVQDGTRVWPHSVLLSLLYVIAGFVSYELVPPLEILSEGVVRILPIPWESQVLYNTPPAIFMIAGLIFGIGIIVKDLSLSLETAAKVNSISAAFLGSLIALEALALLGSLMGAPGQAFWK